MWQLGVTGQRGMKERQENFVKRGSLTFALREVRAVMTSPAYLVGIIGIASLLTIVGAFETGVMLRPVPRFLYWLAVGISTSALGMLTAELMVPRLKALGWSYPLVVVGVALVTVIPVTAAVALVNWAGFGRFAVSALVYELLPQVVASNLVISVTLGYVFRSDYEGQSKSEGPPPILERLPFDKRGDLVALSVSDHYTEIETTKGRELVLLRLGDAIRETAPVTGLRVHRSHWVALGRIRSVRRDGDRAVIELVTGREVPVSRGNMAGLRERGLLPK